MVDTPNPWQAESDDLAAALKAAEQQDQHPPVVGGLTPPPVNPWQAERDAIAAGLKQPPASETFGPPAPAAPYDFIQAAVHGYTGGLIDPVRAALIAGTHYLTGRTPDFNYPEASAQVQRGREAYEKEHPLANLGANLAGAIQPTGMGGLAAKAIEATPTWLGKLATSMGLGAVTSGVQGAAENTTSVDDMLRGAATAAPWGAGTGAAGPIVSAVGGAAFPRLSPEIRTLRAAGVQPTPGTVGGLPGVAEEYLFSHLPLTGPPIRAGQAAAQQELQDALKNLPAGPARNATGQFVSGTAPFATARKDLLAAGAILPAPSSPGILDLGLGGGAGFGLVSHLLEHGIPDWKTLVAAGTVYPAMKALYSHPGRWATTGLLGALGEVPPAVAPLGPVGGQVAPGLLSYFNPNRKAQP